MMQFSRSAVAALGLVVTVATNFAPNEARAAQACPGGLTYAGSASVEHDTGQGAALGLIRVEIPSERDRSYRQGNATGRLVGTDSSGRQAQTPWNGQHNIRGIALEAGGNYYFALGVDVNGQSGLPKIVADVDPSTGEIDQEYLQIGAYCGPGGNGEGCTATIHVCYKP